MAVTFTSKAAQKIKETVERVAQMGPNYKGQPNPPRPTEDSFWAFVLGCDSSGLRHSFVRVFPDIGDDSVDFILDGGMKWKIVPNDPPHLQCAYESSGGRGLTDKIVRMHYAGIRKDDGEACYVFQCESFDPSQWPLPIHDHRDNHAGGFAFATYHPGTSLPQQPWGR